MVVINDDGKSVTKSGGFTILASPSSDVTITSISPAAAMAGDNIDFTITGKDFVTAMNYEVYLYNSDYENITAEDIEVKSATSIKGTFDLDNDADVDTYQLCIKDGFGGIECKKNAFKITTNEVGSIEISSSPTGATIYIDDIANGTTPRTIDDIIVGSYKITLKKAGYQDWAKMVKVEEDETTEVDGTLYAAATTTPTPSRTTTQATPRPTTAPTAIRTTAEKTVRIPTTLADTPTPTEESPGRTCPHHRRHLPCVHCPPEALTRNTAIPFFLSTVPMAVIRFRDYIDPHVYNENIRYPLSNLIIHKTRGKQIMDHRILPSFLAVAILLMFVAVPVTAGLLTVSSISPAVGYSNGKSVTVTITGNEFFDIGRGCLARDVRRG